MSSSLPKMSPHNADCGINPLYVSDPALIAECAKKSGMKSGLIFFVIVGAIYYVLEHGTYLMRKKTDPKAKMSVGDYVRMGVFITALIGTSAYVVPRMVVHRAIDAWHVQRHSLEMLKLQGVSTSDAIRQIQSGSDAKKHAESLIESAAVLGLLI